MPGKSAHVKNEKQYEALRGQRHVQGARREDREQPRRIQQGRRALALRQLTLELVAGEAQPPRRKPPVPKAGRATARKSS